MKQSDRILGLLMSLTNALNMNLEAIAGRWFWFFLSMACSIALLSVVIWAELSVRRAMQKRWDKFMDQLLNPIIGIDRAASPFSDVTVIHEHRTRQ